MSLVQSVCTLSNFVKKISIKAISVKYDLRTYMRIFVLICTKKYEFAMVIGVYLISYR
jgi:hypothetical protein